MLADLDARDEPVMVLGGGSNLVVRDGGFAGHGACASQSARIRIERVGGGERDGGDGSRSRLRVGRRRRRLLGRRWWPSSSASGAVSSASPASPARSARRPSRTSGRTARRSSAPSSPSAPSTAAAERCAPSIAPPAASAYRHSRFKEEPWWIVTQATFELRGRRRRATRSATRSSRARSGCTWETRRRRAEVRRVVLELRRGKGDGARRGRSR